MGRRPCCEKVGLKKGRWTAEEDEILTKYIQANGEGSWRSLPKNAGLLRCGKSCRLRWVNYLKSDLRRGNFTTEEDETIVKLQASLGNRWSVMASHLPGRTDNEIKNYWNSHLRRKLHTLWRPVVHKILPTLIDTEELKKPKTTAAATKSNRCKAPRRATKKNKTHDRENDDVPIDEVGVQFPATPSLESEKLPTGFLSSSRSSSMVMGPFAKDDDIVMNPVTPVRPNQEGIIGTEEIAVPAGFKNFDNSTDGINGDGGNESMGTDNDSDFMVNELLNSDGELIFNVEREDDYLINFKQESESSRCESKNDAAEGGGNGNCSNIITSSVDDVGGVLICKDWNLSCPSTNSYSFEGVEIDLDFWENMVAEAEIKQLLKSEDDIMSWLLDDDFNREPRGFLDFM